MNKNKKKFIKKLKKQNKDDIIDIVCDLYEENFHYKKEIDYLNSVAFSQSETLKWVLNHKSPPKLICEISDDDGDDEVEEIPDLKEKDLRAYV